MLEYSLCAFLISKFPLVNLLHFQDILHNYYLFNARPHPGLNATSWSVIWGGRWRQRVEWTTRDSMLTQTIPIMIRFVETDRDLVMRSALGFVPSGEKFKGTIRKPVKNNRETTENLVSGLSLFLTEFRRQHWCYWRRGRIHSDTLWSHWKKSECANSCQIYCIRINKERTRSTSHQICNITLITLLGQSWWKKIFFPRGLASIDYSKRSWETKRRILHPDGPAKYFIDSESLFSFTLIIIDLLKHEIAQSVSLSSVSISIRNGQWRNPKRNYHCTTPVRWDDAIDVTEYPHLDLTCWMTS